MSQPQPQQRESATIPSPPVIVPELDCSMPASLLRETAYHEQLGLDRSLVAVYLSIEHVVRRLQDKLHRVQEAEQLRGLQQQLVDIEQQHKHDGVWGGSLRDGSIPAGQAVVNGIMEAAHALAAEIIQRVPDHRDTPPQTEV